MENTERLVNAGVDVDALLGRLMGNASLVRVFIKKFAEDQTIIKLEQAFAKRDAKAAEMASHTLKGMCGNLSLTELFALFTEQVNLLRTGMYDSAEAMMDTISKKYQDTLLEMKVWLEEL